MRGQMKGLSIQCIPNRMCVDTTVTEEVRLQLSYWGSHPRIDMSLLVISIKC